ncbi:hypothetical protein [Seonamhaeicola sp.]|uniref:hypothetical protein n=1 Tax=Seonamhaeicola sp. TaxID=1912245 RepID=UPI003569ED78
MSVHSKLLSKWNSLEFGVKTRVFNEFSQQQIDYILKHPNYKDTVKMHDIMDVIDEKAKEVYDEVSEMYNKIQGF